MAWSCGSDVFSLYPFQSASEYNSDTPQVDPDDLTLGESAVSLSGGRGISSPRVECISDQVALLRLKERRINIDVEAVKPLQVQIDGSVRVSEGEAQRERSGSSPQKLPNIPASSLRESEADSDSHLSWQWLLVVAVVVMLIVLTVVGLMWYLWINMATDAIAGVSEAAGAACHVHHMCIIPM